MTIAATSETATDERAKQAFLLVEAGHDQLADMGGRIDRGELKPVLDTIVSFEKADAAYLGKVTRSGRGKVVVGYRL